MPKIIVEDVQNALFALLDHSHRNPETCEVTPEDLGSWVSSFVTDVLNNAEYRETKDLIELHDPLPPA